MNKVPKPMVEKIRKIILSTDSCSELKQQLEVVYCYIEDRIGLTEAHDELWSSRLSDLAEYIQFIDNYPWIYRAVRRALINHISIGVCTLPGLHWLN